MPNPLITVGIPFYNAEKYLLDAIKSIFSQTYQNWELILLDDGSTDNSLKIAKSIRDKRIIVISDGKNLKLPDRLNQIIGLANGKYIARMDADDLCSSTRFEKQISFLESNPDIDVVGTGIMYLDKNDHSVGKGSAVEDHESICSSIERTFKICHASIMAKSVWYKKQCYDKNALLAEDYKLWLQSYRSSLFANIPEPLYYYRLESSISLKKQFIARNTCAKLLYAHFKNDGKYFTALSTFTIQYLKYIITVAMFGLGQREKLLKRRYEALTTEEINIFTNEINSIKNYKLDLNMEQA